MNGQSITPRTTVSAWDVSARPRRGPVGGRLAIMVSIAAHAALAYAVYETKFAPAWREPPERVIDGVIYIPPKSIPPKPQPEAAAPKPKPPLPQPEFAPRPPVEVSPSYVGPTVIALPPAPIQPVVPPQPVAEQAPPPAPPRVIANPAWSSLPDAQDMARYYPERAQRLGIPGRVVMGCRVTAKGSVAECAVISETPGQFGFGEAALRLSRHFRMKPKMEDGQAVEGAAVRIPIAFTLATP